MPLSLDDAADDIDATPPPMRCVIDAVAERRHACFSITRLPPSA